MNSAITRVCKEKPLGIDHVNRDYTCFTHSTRLLWRVVNRTRYLFGAFDDFATLVGQNSKCGLI